MTAYVNGTDSRIKHKTIPYEELTALDSIPEDGVYIIARTDGHAPEIASYRTWHWQIKDSKGNYKPSNLTYTVTKSAYNKMNSNLINALENRRDCELKLHPGSTDYLLVDSVMNIEAFYPNPEIFLFILLGGLILAVITYCLQRSDKKQSKKTAAVSRKAVSSRGPNVPDSTLLTAAALLAVEEDENEERRKKIKESGKCDGDCEHCPPHYGYRYGRWYYGHDHIYGCERGGNRGGGGL